MATTKAKPKGHPCTQCGDFWFHKPTICFWCRAANDPHHNRELLIKAGLHPRVVDTMEERVKRERAARRKGTRRKELVAEPELV